MLKGVNKLIVEINNPDSEYFERAIFFVRPSKADISPSDLTSDADLILSSTEVKEAAKRSRLRQRKERMIKFFVWFVGGILSLLAMAAVFFVL